MAHGFRGQAGHAHQFVGGDALVRVGLDQRPGDGQQLGAVVLGKFALGQLVACFGHRVDPQGGGEHLHAVLLALEQLRLLQPGDGGSHPSVVRGGVALEIGVLVLAQNFAGRRDHRAAHALLSIQIAQRLQNALNLSPRKAGTGGEPELAFHVLGSVEQHAAGRGAIAAGAPRLLQVVFQGTGDVGVNDQTHVRLVDAHAEGVGGDDHPQFPVDEPLLDGLLDLRRQTGVEVFGGNVLAA